MAVPGAGLAYACLVTVWALFEKRRRAIAGAHPHSYGCLWCDAGIRFIGAKIDPDPEVRPNLGYSLCRLKSNPSWFYFFTILWTGLIVPIQFSRSAGISSLWDVPFYEGCIFMKMFFRVGIRINLARIKNADCYNRPDMIVVCYECTIITSAY